MAKEALVEVPGCSCCGMGTGLAQSYHPYAACLMFQQTRSSEATRMNLAAVVEYGMQAQRVGVSLERALSDISSVLFRPEYREHDRNG